MCESPDLPEGSRGTERRLKPVGHLFQGSTRGGRMGIVGLCFFSTLCSTQRSLKLDDVRFLSSSWRALLPFKGNGYRHKARLRGSATRTGLPAHGESHMLKSRWLPNPHQLGSLAHLLEHLGYCFVITHEDFFNIVLFQSPTSQICYGIFSSPKR